MSPDTAANTAKKLITTQDWRVNPADAFGRTTITLSDGRHLRCWKRMEPASAYRSDRAPGRAGEAYL